MTRLENFDTAHDFDRVLPLPYVPTYIARRPKRGKTDEDLSTQPYNSIFALNWQKTSQKNLIYDRSPFIDVEPEWLYTWSKQYDTYKRWYHQKGISQDPPILPEALEQMPTLDVPNHINRTSRQWSQFLDEYPDRFNIDYSQDGVDPVRRPGRHPYRTEKDSLNLSVGHPSRIEPVVNPFRQRDLSHPSANNRPVWLPYGTAARR